MLRAAALARIFNKRALLEKDSASLVPKISGQIRKFFIVAKIKFLQGVKL
jgi:hypothetical protein